MGAGFMNLAEGCINKRHIDLDTHLLDAHLLDIILIPPPSSNKVHFTSSNRIQCNTPYNTSNLIKK
jgi:hypothetical protein